MELPNFWDPFYALKKRDVDFQKQSFLQDQEFLRYQILSLECLTLKMKNLTAVKTKGDRFFKDKMLLNTSRNIARLLMLKFYCVGITELLFLKLNLHIYHKLYELYLFVGDFFFTVIFQSFCTRYG